MASQIERHVTVWSHLGVSVPDESTIFYVSQWGQGEFGV